MFEAQNKLKGIKTMENPGKEEQILKIEKFVLKELENIQKEENMDKKEMIERASVLFNFYKILENYDELQPMLTKDFEEIKNRKRIKDIENPFDRR